MIFVVSAAESASIFDMSPGDAPSYTGLSRLAYKSLKYYQDVLHQRREGRGKCPFHPVCSRFALISLHEYGPVRSALMTLERLLIRENLEIFRNYQKISIDGRTYIYDPPHENIRRRK